VRKLTEWGERLSEGKFGPLNAAVAFVVVYFLCQTAIQPLVSHIMGTGVSIDDAEQLIYVPHLWPGYGGSQPPLFTWINWVATQLFGVSLLTLKIVKYLVLFLAFVSVYGAIRTLGYRQRTAATAMLGLFTVPQIVWEMQHALTHSVASLAFSALAFFALANLLARRDMASHLLFGAAAGLAILAKFNDVIFVVAMVAAALSVPAYRATILDKRFLLGVVVLLLVIAPTALWSLDHYNALFARMQKFGLDPKGYGFLFVRLKGLVEFGIASFDFVVMTVIACGIAFASRRLDPIRRPDCADAPGRLLGRVLLVGYVATAVLVVATGTTVVRDRWLLPVLFLLPPYFAVCAERFGPRGKPVEYGIAIIGAAVAIVLAAPSWYAQAWGGNGKSHTARFDYPVLLKEVTADGPVDTIVSNESWVGNFRLVDQKLVLLNREVPGFDTLIRSPATLIWLGGKAAPAPILQKLREAGYAPEDKVRQVVAPDRLFPNKNHKISFVRLKRVAPSNQVKPAETAPDVDEDSE
jgi:Dolichyl-phosphate-mannose-protein mannosyltransferase